jgi:thymidylate synthase (FAD)
VNEASGRYSILSNEFYLPELDQLGPQSANNKQGRAEVVDLASVHVAKQRQRILHACVSAYNEYDALLSGDVSKEISRGVLPVFYYTELYWKCDLHNFFHFLKLRLDSHAQYEIRVMAEAMYQMARVHFPVAFEAFDDYVKNAKTLSALDIKYLAAVLTGHRPGYEYAKVLGMSKREFNELDAWLDSLPTLKDTI